MRGRTGTARLKVAEATVNLLQNGEFEQAINGKLTGWTAVRDGCIVAAAQGRNGSQTFAMR